jgi:UDP-N-acetylmuramoylalanine--D-glutamate ligase
VTQVGEYSGKSAVVAGLGRSGVAAARLLAREGAVVTGTDLRTASELGPAASILEGAGVGLALGGHDPALFAGADLVVVSPGVRTDQEAFDGARAAGVRIIGELELASGFVRGRMAAITGTNGKSTTTALAGHLAAAGGGRVFTGGNLGVPLCEAALAGAEMDYLIVEVSSFQLDTIESFRPDVAVLLNIRPDHLDRYPSFADYAASKARIFLNQRREEAAVVNEDDPEAVWASSSAHSKVHGFSRKRRPVSGAFIEPDRSGGFRITWASQSGEEEYRFSSPNLPGAHNAENAAAAIASVRLLGVPYDVVDGALRTFKGLEHRIELVATQDGISWYNDSKATNVDSVEVALASFRGGIVWIAGGRHKGAPYSPLRHLVSGRVKAVLLIGESAETIASDLAGAAEFIPCGTMENAVREAARIASPGDTVLLSPACSSFDQFRNYEERGRTFKALVAAATGGADGKA